MLPNLPPNSPTTPATTASNQPVAPLTNPFTTHCPATDAAPPRQSNAIFYGIAAFGALGAAFWIGPSLLSAKPAPQFTLYASGTTRAISLADYQGKVVVLDFWASWCPPCRAAIPALERLNQQYKGAGVKVLGINVNENGNVDPQQFMQSLGATYTTLMQGEAVAAEYKVKGIPTLVVIGKDGSVKFKESGWAPQFEAKMQEVINKELGL